MMTRFINFTIKVMPKVILHFLIDGKNINGHIFSYGKGRLDPNLNFLAQKEQADSVNKYSS